MTLTFDQHAAAFFAFVLACGVAALYGLVLAVRRGVAVECQLAIYEPTDGSRAPFPNPGKLEHLVGGRPRDDVRRMVQRFGLAARF